MQQVSEGNGVLQGEAYHKGEANTNKNQLISKSNQLQIFKLFANQVNLEQLPFPEPGIISGNSMEYPQKSNIWTHVFWFQQAFMRPRILQIFPQMFQMQTIRPWSIQMFQGREREKRKTKTKETV